LLLPPPAPDLLAFDAAAADEEEELVVELLDGTHTSLASMTEADGTETVAVQY
jgi:hypothetical protein